MVFNCLEALCRFSRLFVNHVSGLPNTFGDYDETPEITGKLLKVQQLIMFISRYFIKCS